MDNPYEFLLPRHGNNGNENGGNGANASNRMQMQSSAHTPMGAMTMGYSYAQVSNNNAMLDMALGMHPIPYEHPGYNGMDMMGHAAPVMPHMDAAHHGMAPMDPFQYNMTPARPDHAQPAFYTMNAMNYSMYSTPNPHVTHDQQLPQVPQSSIPKPTNPRNSVAPYQPPPQPTFNAPRASPAHETSPVQPVSTLTTTASGQNGSEASYESSEEVNAKSEKRRSQVRDASRRRRAKHKEEEANLVKRISELKKQVELMEGPTSNGDSLNPTSGMTDHDMEQAFKDQQQIVEKLKGEHRQLQEKLKEHEEFARQLQKGIQHLSGGGGAPMGSLTGGFSNMISSGVSIPPQTFDWSWIYHGDVEWIHEIVRTGFQELYQWKPPVNGRDPVNASAMGWTSDFWESEHTMCFSTKKSIHNAVMREFVSKTWDILSNRDKSRRVYPDWKELEVLKWVSEDIVVVRIFESTGSRNVTF
ncbi:hypothetical protein THRCLA_09856, partial [Thraustotheca clavata]